MEDAFDGLGNVNIAYCAECAGFGCPEVVDERLYYFGDWNRPCFESEHPLPEAFDVIVHRFTLGVPDSIIELAAVMPSVEDQLVLIWGSGEYIYEHAGERIVSDFVPPETGPDQRWIIKYDFQNNRISVFVNETSILAFDVNLERPSNPSWRFGLDWPGDGSFNFNPLPLDAWMDDYQMLVY